MTTRTNEQWLTDLTSETSEEAIADLREMLVRGLRYTLSRRVDDKLDVLVEDFAQEALLKILDKLDTFRGESQFTTWAQKIAVRVAYTELRRKRWQDSSLEAITTPRDGDGEYTPLFLADQNPTPEDSSTQDSMVYLVKRLIAEELTDRQREAVINLMIKGLSMEEVAELMDTNRNALYKLVHDARVRLKTRLEKENLSPEEVLAAFSD
ncbi:MAG: RNA polymerase sigma factor [Anaerolineales bacterium]|nr:RNA polymerase sigma factor [Anaerolineales bacterium]